jgi:hypothetical protein
MARAARPAPNGLVADDGERQTWATIRSGFSVGLQELIDLEPMTERHGTGGPSEHHA